MSSSTPIGPASTPQPIPLTSRMTCQVALTPRRTGQSWDNLLVESFFASLKGELIDTQPWVTRAAPSRAGPSNT